MVKVAQILAHSFLVMLAATAHAADRGSAGDIDVSADAPDAAAKSSSSFNWIEVLRLPPDLDNRRLRSKLTRTGSTWGIALRSGWIDSPGLCDFAEVAGDFACEGARPEADDELLAVQGIDVRFLRHAGVINLFKQLPRMEIEFVRPERVTGEKAENENWGFGIELLADGSHQVAQISVKCPIPDLHAGDLIRRVGDREILGLDQSEVVELVCACSDQIAMTVSRLRAPRTIEEDRLVRIARNQGEPWGVDVHLAGEDRLVVDKVPAAWAGDDTMLHKGDEILDQASPETLKKTLGELREIMLRIRRNP